MPGAEETVSDAEILRWIALASTPVVTTTDLVDRLDMSQQGVYKRLKSLEEDGLIRSKKVGAKARVWWITDRGRQFMGRRYFES